MEGNTEFQEPQKPPQENIKPETQSLEAAEVGWLRGLRKRFNRVFSKEQRTEEPFPKIDIDIFYSAHDTAFDMGGLEKQFEEADIYIPELFGWRKEDLDTFKKLSNGNFFVLELVEALRDKNLISSAQLREYKIIYNSHKPIAIIDVPRNHTHLDKKVRTKRHQLLIHGEDNFSDILSRMKVMIKNESRAEKDREKYMISRFKQAIKEVLEEYPVFKEKNKIKVLLSLGEFHTFVYHALKREGENVSRDFNTTMPLVFSLWAEGVRKFHFGKEAANESVAKIFLGFVFYAQLDRSVRDLTQDSDKVARFERKIISQFSFEEAKEIFEKLKQGESAWQLFETKFAEKGIKIPSSEKELDEYLVKPMTKNQ